MTVEEFAKLMETHALHGTVKNLISNFTSPPGRRPRKEIIDVSTFFLKLSTPEKEIFETAIFESVRQSIFAVFSIIDGATIVDPVVQKFLISAKFDEKKSEVINGDEYVDIHDYFAPS